MLERIPWTLISQMHSVTNYHYLLPFGWRGAEDLLGDFSGLHRPLTALTALMKSSAWSGGIRIRSPLSIMGPTSDMGIVIKGFLALGRRLVCL